MPTAFTGGALSFKGDKKKKKKAKKKESQAKHKLKDDTVVSPTTAVAPVVEDMTPAERRALERKQERIRIDNEKLAAKSHRERIEEFNEKLGSATEHNDIPRVSPMNPVHTILSKFKCVVLIRLHSKCCYRSVPLEMVNEGRALLSQTISCTAS